MKRIANSKEFRQQLMSLRSRLTGDVLNLSDEAFRNSGKESSQPTHMAELGTETNDQEIALQVLQNEESVLEEINAAIDRLKEGKFGYCEKCEKVIPKPRLAAIPYTRYCVKCQQDVEAGH